MADCLIRRGPGPPPWPLLPPLRLRVRCPWLLLELRRLCASPAVPQAMLKYVDICVDMKAGRKCKDALINYRNACQQVRARAPGSCAASAAAGLLEQGRAQQNEGDQVRLAAPPCCKLGAARPSELNFPTRCRAVQVNVGSLEEVIKYLLQVASARAEEASKAAAAQLDAVEDLEAEASPEEMMLSYVSGEKTKDRTDREVVTPWFKFLWETYRWGRGRGRWLMGRHLYQWEEQVALNTSGMCGGAWQA